MLKTLFVLLLVMQISIQVLAQEDKRDGSDGREEGDLTWDEQKTLPRDFPTIYILVKNFSKYDLIGIKTILEDGSAFLHADFPNDASLAAGYQQKALFFDLGKCTLELQLMKEGAYHSIQVKYPHPFNTHTAGTIIITRGLDIEIEE